MPREMLNMGSVYDKHAEDSSMGVLMEVFGKVVKRCERDSWQENYAWKRQKQENAAKAASSRGVKEESSSSDEE